MEITERTASDVESIEPYPITLVTASGIASSIEENVQTEHTIDVIIEGVPTMRIVCTPDHLGELVLGRLFTEGIVDSAEDVELISICEFGSKAQVILKNRRADYTREHIETVPSCCTGNKVYNTYFTTDDTPGKVVPIGWDADWVFSLARRFALDTPMHRKTFGSHSCYLAIGDQVKYCCEDLGRHNAFDKVIGCALRDGLDLSNAIIFTSGRLPVDMVAKAVRAGVPLLISKAVPTSATIEIAREFDLTLICSARPDSFKVYNDPQVSAAE